MNKDAVDAHGIPDITHVSFMIGAVLSISTILWSVFRVPELPLSTEEKAKIDKAPKGVVATLAEIWDAIIEMPKAMQQMAWMSLFQWYGLSIYWSYAVLSIGRSIYQTGDKGSAAFRDAALTNGQVGALYNMIAFAGAFAMVPLARRYGPKMMHMACLTLAGLGMFYLPRIGGPAGEAPWIFQTLAMPQLGQHLALIIPAIGMGLGWASIMGNPYVILAGSIPPERTGVYMGIFNMMIVIPMLINGLTFGWIYRNLLGADPRNALMMGGTLLICAAVTMIWVKDKNSVPAAV
jgi:maltose/moltooligosaccharide transporter